MTPAVDQLASRQRVEYARAQAIFQRVHDRDPKPGEGKWLVRFAKASAALNVHQRTKSQPGIERAHRRMMTSARRLGLFTVEAAR